MFQRGRNVRSVSCRCYAKRGCYPRQVCGAAQTAVGQAIHGIIRTHAWQSVVAYVHSQATAVSSIHTGLLFIGRGSIKDSCINQGLTDNPLGDR